MLDFYYNVLQLEISVDPASTMHDLQGFQHLAHHLASLDLIQGLPRDTEFVEVLTLDPLHDDVVRVRGFDHLSSGS